MGPKLQMRRKDIKKQERKNSFHSFSITYVAIYCQTSKQVVYEELILHGKRNPLILGTTGI